MWRILSVILNYQTVFKTHFAEFEHTFRKKAFGVKFLIPFWLSVFIKFASFARKGEQLKWNCRAREVLVYYRCVQTPPVYKLQKLPLKKEGNLPHTAKAIHFDKMHAFVNHKQTFNKTVSLFLLIPCRRVQFSLPVSLSKRPEHQISALDCQVWSLFPFKFQNTDTLIGVHSVRQQHLRDIFAKI